MRAFLPDSEQHEVFSATRERNYMLSVVLPEGYHTSDKRYPVVYVLDGDLIFGLVASLTPITAMTEEVPELIAVCIGYGTDSFDEWGELRDVDLWYPGSMAHDLNDPANPPQPDVFMRALTEDIVPFVDRTYRTDPDDRCLQGYSAGGFFVLYALLQQSGTFHRFLSGSGFGYSTMGYLCDEAQRVTGGDTWRVPLRTRPPDSLAGHVFVAMAEHEARSCVSAMHEFVETLEAAGSSDLHLVSEVFPTEVHGAAGFALTYLHGLRSVFAAIG